MSGGYRFGLIYLCGMLILPITFFADEPIKNTGNQISMTMLGALQEYYQYAVPFLALMPALRYLYNNETVSSYGKIYLQIEGFKSVVGRTFGACRTKINFLYKKIARTDVESIKQQKAEKKIRSVQEVERLRCQITYLEKEVQQLTEANEKMQKIITNFQDSHYNHGVKDGMLQMLGSKEEKEKLLVNYGQLLGSKELVEYLKSENESLKTQLKELSDYFKMTLQNQLNKPTVESTAGKNQSRIVFTSPSTKPLSVPFSVMGYLDQ